MPVGFRIAESANRFAINNNVRQLKYVAIPDFCVIFLRPSAQGYFFKGAKPGAESLECIFIYWLIAQSQDTIPEPCCIYLVKLGIG
jgi:hypothetical protein